MMWQTVTLMEKRSATQLGWVTGESKHAAHGTELDDHSGYRD